MKKSLQLLCLVLLLGLTACTGVNDENGFRNDPMPGDSQLSAWRGTFAVDLTHDKTFVATTTLRVSGTALVFEQLPDVASPVTAYYLHTGSSDVNEYFDLTPKDELAAEKWVAIYQKKTDLWSGVIIVKGKEYQFTATKRISQ